MSDAIAQTKIDLNGLAARLGPAFADRAERSDEEDAFAVENFAELKRARAFSACVPTELGGGGASHAELAAFLREIATYCGSTALAFSMHSHVVATAVWRWRHDKAPLEPLLRTQLYGITPTDPLTLVAVPVTLVAVAALAALIPARRAMRVAPATALRAD